MVIRTGQTIVLPTDWNPKKNLWILWGAGGKGQGGFHTFGANFSGCGGGAGGCRVYSNVGNLGLGFQRGDSVIITVAVGNLLEWDGSGGPDYTTFTMASNPAQGAGVNSGSNSGPVGTLGERGLGGDDGPFPNNLGGLSFSTAGAGGSCAGPSVQTMSVPPTSYYNAGLTPNITFSSNGGHGGAGAMYCAPLFLSQRGEDPTTNVGGYGGNGPYGTGGGAPDSDATPNTGGGGGGASAPGGIAGKGASWTYGMSLTTDTWMPTEGNMEFSIDGIFGADGDWTGPCVLTNFLMLNGTVPAGGGGGGQCVWTQSPGDGGDGGWPGGGGGSTDQQIVPTALPGLGAAGLMMIFYDPIPPVWFPNYPDFIFPDPIEYQRKLGPQFLPPSSYIPLPLDTICPSMDGDPIPVTPELCPNESSAMTDLLPIWGGMKG